MARTKYTVSFPAAKAGDEVTWPNSVKVYPDANAVQPLTNGYIEGAGGSFTGWSEASSVTFSRQKGDGTTDDVTVTAGAPTGTGAAAPTTTGTSSAVNPTHKSADYAAQDHDGVLVNASSASLTVTLPAPASQAFVVVKKVDATVNTVTIAPHASEVIDGAASQVLFSRNDSMTFVSDGTDWFVI